MVLSEIINSKHNTMYTDKTVGYLAPEIEVNEVMVEMGIAASNMEKLGTVYDDQDW